VHVVPTTPTKSSRRRKRDTSAVASTTGRSSSASTPAQPANNRVADPGLDRGPGRLPKHPFAADPGDHCETPLQAYKDIDPVLAAIARALGKSKAELQIFDPFFCAGATVSHLHSLRYTNVWNENRDWFETLRGKTVKDRTRP
jgi:hypothetical protein